jgi:hypothetical protein
MEAPLVKPVGGTLATGAAVGYRRLLLQAEAVEAVQKWKFKPGTFMLFDGPTRRNAEWSDQHEYQ